MQVIDDLAAIIMRDGEPLEASIMEGISHPNIVNIIAHAVTDNTRQKWVIPHHLHSTSPAWCAGARETTIVIVSACDRQPGTICSLDILSKACMIPS